MESVTPGYDDGGMDLLITIGAVVTGAITVVVGMFSLAAIWLDDHF